MSIDTQLLSFSVGPLEIAYQSQGYIESAPCSPGGKQQAHATIYKLSHPDGWVLKIAFMDFGDDRDVRCLEYSITTPIILHRIAHGLRLGVHRLDSKNNFLELRQAQLKDSSSKWSNLKKVAEEELDEKAGVSLRNTISRLGGAFGTRQQLLSDKSRRRTDLCAVFPDTQYLIPLFSYAATRVLPLLREDARFDSK